MKNLIVIALAVLLTSCATDKYLLSSEEMNKSPFSIEGHTVKKGNEVIGRITSTEIEIDAKGNMVKEFSFTLENMGKSAETEALLKFLHTKFPNKKIEINLDGVLDYE